MSVTKLTQGDRVRYAAAQRRMTAIVAEHLPFPGIREVPVLKRRRVVWMARDAVRKLPSKP